MDSATLALVLPDMADTDRPSLGPVRPRLLLGVAAL
jgi:hypothetical protein